MKKSTHYIDNDHFYNEMKDWIKLVKEAENEGDPMPPVTDYIGLCFMNIAENLSKKGNFVKYSFRDEMVSDAIENCIMYAHNFDPDKSKNPFSYFTQITYFAFLRRIEKEKKQMYIRFKSSHNMVSQGATYESNEVQLHLNTNADYINAFIEDFEDKLHKNKEKNKK